MGSNVYQRDSASVVHWSSTKHNVEITTIMSMDGRIAYLRPHAIWIKLWKCFWTHLSYGSKCGAKGFCIHVILIEHKAHWINYYYYVHGWVNSIFATSFWIKLWKYLWTHSSYGSRCAPKGFGICLILIDQEASERNYYHYVHGWTKWMKQITTIKSMHDRICIWLLIML